MYCYVDESGHTGVHLFDPNQPILFYGVLTSRVDLDVVAEPVLFELRAKLGVDRLHAAELGNGRLVQISQELLELQITHGLTFDFYRVNKPDHAIISFFDQVFDSGMNRAVPWAAYWTERRYFILLEVARLFNEDSAKLAWKARIQPDAQVAAAMLVSLCEMLMKRIGRVQGTWIRRIIRHALKWAVQNPLEISYNVSDVDQVKQISPNIIGFQSVMHGIARRIRGEGLQATKIIVDRQTEFNKAQKTLADFFAKAAGIKFQDVPGVMQVDFDDMPQVPIEFKAGTASAGLELVDFYLWVFKRWYESKALTNELKPFFEAQIGRGYTDEVSLAGIIHRINRQYQAPIAGEDFAAL